jgi:hypothetical protein
MNKDIKIGDYVIALRKRKSVHSPEILVEKGDIGEVVGVYPSIDSYEIDFSKGNNKKVVSDGHWMRHYKTIRKIPDFLIPNIQAMSGYKGNPDIGDWVYILDKGFDQNAFGLWGKVLSIEPGFYFIEFSMNIDYKSPFKDEKALLKSRTIRVIPALLNKEDSEYKEGLKIGDSVSILANRYNYIKKGMIGEIKKIKQHTLLIKFKKINNPGLDRDYIYPVTKAVKLKVIPKLPDQEDALFPTLKTSKGQTRITGNIQTQPKNLKISDLSIALSLKDYEKALEVLPAHPIFDSILKIRKEAEKSQKFAEDYKELLRKTKTFISEIQLSILLDDMEAIANMLTNFKSYVETLPTDNLYLKK